MPLIVDDAFYEYAREYGLPDCSVSFLMRAGSYSARNSRSGFVPNSMLADFSSDPDLAVRTLQAAGIVKRADGGVRILEGRGVTVVNAADATADKARQDAAAEAERAGKSAGGQHGNHRRWHEKRGIRVPGCSFCEGAGTETAAPGNGHRIAIACDSEAIRKRLL